jgi:DNA-binding CsgD family transcriptional regulator
MRRLLRIRKEYDDSNWNVYTMPNIFAEFLLAALRFAALWIIFHLLHKPRTRVRFVLALIIMIVQYPFCRILFFASGNNFVANVVCDTLLFLTLAFICEGELVRNNPEADSPPVGDLVRPVISAFYFNGMLQLINYVMGCYRYALTGPVPPSFSLWSYFARAIEGIILFLWCIFYYRIARNMTAKAPLSFSLLTVLTPLVGLAVIAAGTGASHNFREYEARIFLCGGLFGTLIIVLNMCVFYLYIKLSVAHEALVFAHDLAQALPVWTPENGLSGAFITRYEITPREREVIEIMQQGNTDKEIAACLNIAVNTVQAHLKRIYRKTGASGRFALIALISGTKRRA